MSATRGASARADKGRTCGQTVSMFNLTFNLYSVVDRIRECLSQHIQFKIKNPAGARDRQRRSNSVATPAALDRRCLSQHIKFEIQIFIYWDRGKSLKYDMVKFSNYVHSLELHTKPLINI